VSIADGDRQLGLGQPHPASQKAQEIAKGGEFF
jgi:hypothetical protein